MALVAMKRLRAVALQSQRRPLLRQLRRLGCVEVETAAGSTDFKDGAALPQTVEENTGAREFLAAITQAKQTLDHYAPPEKRPMFARKPQLTEGQLYDEKVLDAALRAARKINRATQEIARLTAEQNRLEASLAQLKPWLALDVPLDYEAHGSFFYCRGVLPAAADLASLEQELEEKAPESQMERVSSDTEQHYVTLLVHNGSREAALSVLKQKGFSQVTQRDAEGTAGQWEKRQRAEIEAMKRQQEELVGTIRSERGAHAMLEQAIDAYAQEAEEDELLSGLAHTKETVVLTGWLPEKAAGRVADVLERYGCAYSLDEPQEGEDPPTAMDNGPLAEPFGAVTEMYGMPAYGSLVDPNPLMVPFYITFFGFIMGDAIYGIIITLGCFLGLRLMRPKGTMRQMLTLFMYCGVSTIVAGVLMGGWLSDGVNLFAQTFLGAEGEVIGPLWFNPLEEPMKMLIFSLGLGALQIVTGMAVSAWRQLKRGQWLDALVDTGSWYLVFAGIGLAVGLGLNFGIYLAIAGVAIMLVLGGHGKKGLGRITGGLGKLYDVTGYVSDLLSYSRIMALGLSGAVVGSVVNKMGAMGGGGIVGVVLFIVVGLIGHTFNIAISLLGAYVHTSRLQYIEFFGRFYEGGGRIMKPLKNKTKYVEITEED